MLFSLKGLFSSVTLVVEFFCILFFMKKFGQQLRSFFSTPFGIVVLFVIIFYVMTFGVYYFYGPGPEERRQAGSGVKTAQERAYTAGRQGMSIEVQNSIN